MNSVIHRIFCINMTIDASVKGSAPAYQGACEVPSDYTGSRDMAMVGWCKCVPHDITKVFGMLGTLLDTVCLSCD